ncbi:hypothetical protein DFH06DRAFT_245971 [Mycena polygramma]|nr:hypothetical protein DFH06DRAFT_245971 [Mycena polygramma]
MGGLSERSPKISARRRTAFRIIRATVCAFSWVFGMPAVPRARGSSAVPWQPRCPYLGIMYATFPATVSHALLLSQAMLLPSSVILPPTGPLFSTLEQCWRPAQPLPTASVLKAHVWAPETDAQITPILLVSRRPSGYHGAASSSRRACRYCCDDAGST